MTFDITRRGLLKLGVASAALWWLRPGDLFATALSVPVLMYHDIGPAAGEYTVTPPAFSAQMEWLYSSGFKAVLPREIERLKPGELADAVVITFDDGYASYMEYAFALFEQYGFKSVINVIGSLAGKYIEEAGARRPLLSWDEYRHILATGLVEIGCHTYNLHVYAGTARPGALSVPASELGADLALFQEVLKKETGAVAETLAWPYGIYDEAAVAAAKRAGFRYLLTSDPGRYKGDGDRVARLNVSGSRTLAAFRGLLSKE